MKALALAFLVAQADKGVLLLDAFPIANVAIDHAPRLGLGLAGPSRLGLRLARPAVASISERKIEAKRGGDRVHRFTPPPV